MLENMIAPANIAAVKNIIENGSDFAILVHRNPDGDAIGSASALALFLRSLGKQAHVIVPNDFPDFLKWLPECDKILVYESEQRAAADALLAAVDAIFCLDFNTLSRISELGETVSALPAPRLLIDHHPAPDNDFSVIISHPESCSTSELVYRLIYRINGVSALAKEIAECVYVGMMTDTGSFAYASNRKDIYLIVAELIAAGIDKDLIYRKVFYNYSTNRLRLFGYMMYRKMKTFPRSNATLTTLTYDEVKRFSVMRGDTEGLVNMPLQIKGVRFSCFLREEQSGKINVSLRSVDDFPCNAVAAEFFNGGGHKNASGGELHCTMDEAVEVFYKAIRKYYPLLVK